MTTEQRLIDALGAAHGYEPSPDLWGRVLHSIEEDRRHRRRVLLATLVVVVTLLVGAAVAVANVQEGLSPWLGSRYRIDWRVMEGLEIGALLVLIAALGPAIRRFGRGYVGDVFRAHPSTGPRLLGLLDVAYVLLFVGYLLVTTRLGIPDAYAQFRIGDQIEEAAVRIGGLLLVMGVMHALTLMVMPLVGLVFTANRRRRRLPRWVTILLLVASAWVAAQTGFISLGILGGVD